MEVLPRVLLSVALALPLTYAYDAVRGYLLHARTLLPVQDVVSRADHRRGQRIRAMLHGAWSSVAQGAVACHMRNDQRAQGPGSMIAQ